VGRVSICGWEMGEDFRPVNSTPVERTVGELVDQGPRKLLSDEPFDVSASHNLGELRAVPESVRHEEYFTVFAKMIFKEVLTIKELTDH